MFLLDIPDQNFLNSELKTASKNQGKQKNIQLSDSKVS